MKFKSILIYCPHKGLFCSHVTTFVGNNEVKSRWRRKRVMASQNLGNVTEMTKLLFAQISVALSIVTVLLLFYGAYLFDIGVISKSAIFETLSLPLLGSIYCAWRAK